MTQAPGFVDLYAHLDVETRIIVQQRTSEIKTLMRRTAQDIVEIGQRLIEVKAQLEHGLFGTWLQAEFGWSRSTALRFMRVAEQFKFANLANLSVASSAIYLLADSSTPESAREEILQRAESGEHITLGAAQEIIQEHKQPQTTHAQSSRQEPVETTYARPSAAAPAVTREAGDDQCSTDSPQDEQVGEHISRMPRTTPGASVILPLINMPISETPGYDSDEWYTPADYIESARAVMGDIDLDPATCAAAQQVIQAAAFFTKEDDGLTQPWHGRVWLNPPYSASLVQGFVDKLCREFDVGRTTEAIVLVNNATDTAWFHSLLQRSPACVLRRRVPFWRPGFNGGGARQGQVIFYMGHNVDRFRSVFSQYGVIVTATCWTDASEEGA